MRWAFYFERSICASAQLFSKFCFWDYKMILLDLDLNSEGVKSISPRIWFKIQSRSMTNMRNSIPFSCRIVENVIMWWFNQMLKFHRALFAYSKWIVRINWYRNLSRSHNAKHVTKFNFHAIVCDLLCVRNEKTPHWTYKRLRSIKVRNIFHTWFFCLVSVCEPHVEVCVYLESINFESVCHE